MSALAEIRREDPLRRPSEPKREQMVISHRKDADGITAAALIHNVTRAKVSLTDYSEMIETLSQVPQDIKEVFICDLGLNKSTFDGFVGQVKRLSAQGEVHYIDHHPLDPDYERKIKEAGADLFHSREECAAILVYKKFEEQLRSNPNMKILACCGAITDYMDLQPFAKKLIASFDRQFLLYEATVLSFSIAMIGREGVSGNPLLVQIVEELGGNGRLPHEVENASSYSQEFASNSAAILEKARRDGKKMKHFAYFKTRESSTGNVANFLVGAFDIPVGVAFREDGPDHYEISLRSTEASKSDLGKVVSKISNTLEASGGGHVHAAGSRIKREQFEEFVQLLDKELSYNE